MGNDHMFFFSVPQLKQNHVLQNGSNGTVSGEVGKHGEKRDNLILGLKDCNNDVRKLIYPHKTANAYYG